MECVHPEHVKRHVGGRIAVYNEITGTKLCFSLYKLIKMDMVPNNDYILFSLGIFCDTVLPASWIEHV